ncbi:hypothetical protein AB0C34_28880 [Nocardia sp. NPDC049220]|uniref:hypothetical protein n=1 Tax=Nocardia sp. NPDC049220 TaxID=3155273 RepID=UPI0033FB4290
MTLSKRGATTPREAKPQAMSFSGSFGPLVSSRSNGPPPLSGTTAGHSGTFTWNAHRAHQCERAGSDGDVVLGEGARIDVERRLPPGGDIRRQPRAVRASVTADRHDHRQSTARARYRDTYPDEFRIHPLHGWRAYCGYRSIC